MILVEGLARHYRIGDELVRAVDGVDLEIGRGESVALLGPSGSGKSTLMHLLGALDRPSVGTIVVDGQDLSRLSEAKAARYRSRNIGFVFQSFYLQSHLSARENVELPLKLAGVPRAERQQRAEQLLTAVGLEDRLAHRPTELSGGQQQRVSIARALANDPQILLADEPTGNLDSRTGLEMIELFGRLRVERGLTLVLVTHDAEIAERMDRVVRMKDGRVIEDQSRVVRPTVPAERQDGAPVPRRSPLATAIDCWLEVGRGLRRHKLRTALTTFGIAVGAMAITLMVGLGVGLHDFILTQAESINDPLSLWVVNSQYSWQDIVGNRASQLGRPPRLMREKTLERIARARSGFTPFTEEQVDKIRSLPGVSSVRPRTYVIMDGVRLIPKGREGLDAARPEASDRTGRPTVFDAGYFVGYALVRSAKARFRLRVGRPFAASHPRQVILSYQYAEAWKITPSELIGREVELLFPSLDQLGRFSWIVPKQVEANYRGYRARVVGVTKKSILSSVVFLSPRFGEEITRFQFAKRLTGEGMEGGNLASVELLVELSRLIAEPALQQALREGGGKRRELAEVLSELAKLPSRLNKKQASGPAMLMLMAQLSRARMLLDDPGLTAALRAGSASEQRLEGLLRRVLGLARPSVESATISRPWGARIRVRVAAEKELPAVRAEIVRLGFKVRSLRENLEMVARVFGVLDAFLSSFGLIALFVAALGIANTLIMAVLERTQEIGVMKAVGATAGKIRALFAMEAVGIGLLGGLVGVLLGVGGGQGPVGWRDRAERCAAEEADPALRAARIPPMCGSEPRTYGLTVREKKNSRLCTRTVLSYESS